MALVVNGMSAVGVIRGGGTPREILLYTVQRLLPADGTAPVLLDRGLREAEPPVPRCALSQLAPPWSWGPASTQPAAMAAMLVAHACMTPSAAGPTLPTARKLKGALQRLGRRRAILTMKEGGAVAAALMEPPTLLATGRKQQRMRLRVLAGDLCFNDSVNSISRFTANSFNRSRIGGMRT